MQADKVQVSVEGKKFAAPAYARVSVYVGGLCVELAVTDNLESRGYVLTHPASGLRVCMLRGNSSGQWNARAQAAIDGLALDYGADHVESTLRNADAGIFPWWIK